jgi:hypothetical protein
MDVPPPPGLRIEIGDSPLDAAAAKRADVRLATYIGTRVDAPSRS